MRCLLMKMLINNNNSVSGVTAPPTPSEPRLQTQNLGDSGGIGPAGGDRMAIRRTPQAC